MKLFEWLKMRYNRIIYYIWKTLTHRKVKTRMPPLRGGFDVLSLDRHGERPKINIFNNPFWLFICTATLHSLFGSKGKFYKDQYHNNIGQLLTHVTQKDWYTTVRDQMELRIRVETLLERKYTPVNYMNYRLRQYGFCVLGAWRLQDTALFDKAIQKFAFAVDCSVHPSGWFLENWNYCLYSDVIFPIMMQHEMIRDEGYLQRVYTMAGLIGLTAQCARVMWSEQLTDLVALLPRYAKCIYSFSYECIAYSIIMRKNGSANPPNATKLNWYFPRFPFDYFYLCHPKSQKQFKEQNIHYRR